MRTFEHPNLDNFKCPICGTSDDKEVVLIGIDGTESGNNIEAKQFHMDCLDLRYTKTSNVIYQYVLKGKVV